MTVDDRNLLADTIESEHSSGNGKFTQWVEASIGETTTAGRDLLTSSCTHALEMSALLRSLKPGDEVNVPSFTFVSIASAFARFGARPVFIDSRCDTLNIETVRSFIP